MRARTIAIGVRDADLQSYTRQTTLRTPTNSTTLVAEAAWRLLRANEPLDKDHPLRSMSVRASDLVPASAPVQLPLWGNDRVVERERLDASIDELRRRFGNGCVRRGIELHDRSLAGIDVKRDHVVFPVSFFHD